MSLHLSRMRRNVNRKVYNDRIFLARQRRKTCLPRVNLRQIAAESLYNVYIYLAIIIYMYV